MALIFAADDTKLRSASDTLTIYQPYQVPSHDTFRGELRFLKISSPAPANSMATNGQTRLQSLRLLSDVDGYSAVLVTGLSPYIILKPAASQPHIIELCEAGVRSISGFHTDDCSNGFIWSDEEVFPSRYRNLLMLILVGYRLFCKPSIK